VIQYPGGGAWRWPTVAGWFYLTTRRVESGGEVRWELGAIGHGLAAAELTEYLCVEIRTWAPEREQHTPTLTVYPTGTPDSELAGPAIDKTHSRFVLTYDNVNDNKQLITGDVT
jgi:protein-L-isoaspartate(D-aspartate) O-methyltransferase